MKTYLVLSTASGFTVYHEKLCFHHARHDAKAWMKTMRAIKATKGYGWMIIQCEARPAHGYRLARA